MEEIHERKNHHKHFSRLHEKVQTKFEEMQKKLEKSRSIDSLSVLKEDYVYKDKRYGSVTDMSQIDETEHSFMSPQSYNPNKSALYEEKCDVNIKYVDVKDLRASESELVLNDDDFIENHYFGHGFSNVSLESLDEVPIENDEHQSIPPSPVSIREKIGLAITVAKDKRRQRVKERNEAKDKKKESKKKVEKFVLSNSPKQDILKTFKKTKVATVNIALIDATGLDADILEERTRLLLCRFRLGNEKYKTKIMKSNSSTVKWQELFNFTLFEDKIVEASLWDKDTCIGRSCVDLSDMAREKTHQIRLNLEGGEGKGVQIFMLLTITGISIVDTFVDFDNYRETENQLEIIKKRPWYYFQKSGPFIGRVSIIVYGAKGLAGNDCYCILEMNNERLQTDTEFKTSEPNWMKIFTFDVTDVTSIVNITVNDEKKSEDVGKLCIPLLNIKSGEKKWYALKDSNLRDRARGHNPRILLEMKITWDPVKASLRVVNPKETLYLEIEDKLDRQIFAKNLARAKAVLNWTLDAFKVIKMCFEWESPKQNLMAITIWLLFCWFFQIWMLPLLLLIPFVWYRPPKLNKGWNITHYEIVEKKEDDEKKSLRQKLQGLQDMVQTVQNFIGQFANLGESIKNLFNFTVPFLSHLAIFLILAVSAVMCLIPIKYIFMIWGIHKFARKTLRPNRIPNNEILDLLSRVPNDEVLLDCAEIPLEEIPQEDVIS